MNSRGDNIYFVSDCHFGIPDHEQSLEREKKLVKWLSEVSADAAEIYILGDLFDFWFEYKTVVPRGYTRLLGKLAELTDRGITIHLFTGNHDMWMFDYFSRELGIEITRRPVDRNCFNLKLMIGHGDGLGPGDYGYKFIKKVFASKLCQWLFARLHPNFAMGLGLFFSRRSRLARGESDYVYKGDAKERLLQYCIHQQGIEHHDIYVFGHRHLPLDLPLPGNARYVNLGDWIVHFTYGKLSEKGFELLSYPNEVKIQ